jgi:primosomal protein N' (replication factor Y) (superfamily II helicase)
VGTHRRRRRAGGGGEGRRLSESNSDATSICRVQPDVPAVHRAFDYRLPAELADHVHVGTIVRVPLHGRRVRAWVLDRDVTVTEVDPARLLTVLAVVSAGPPPDVVDLCRWAAWRWAGPLATFLRAASPPNVVRAGDEPEAEVAVYPSRPGMAEESLVVVSPSDPGTSVAALVASEGSTLVIDADAERAERLVEELEGQGREVLVVRSEHPASARATAWDRARAGAHVVVGGRSAVWAPVPDLARVVIVDEADEALEEERAPTWNARDVALERAHRSGASVRVVTPAPSIDVLVALREPVRAPRTRWPRVIVVDQRDEEPGHGLLTDTLARELRRNVDAGRLAVCVLNRRGRARLLACRSCHELARCDRCGATVTQSEDDLVCTRCGTSRPLVCSFCHGTRFRAVRPGVKSVRDDLAALLPRASVASVDASAVDLPEAEVLVGTEAVLHRAPRGAGVVAFLELDQELLAPRARAAEQALWLLVRGARLLTPSPDAALLVQTRIPEHEVVAAARTGDPWLVADAERARRRALDWPPFGGAAELSGDAVAVRAACDALRELDGITVLGPADAKGEHGVTRALVRAPDVDTLCDALAAPDVDRAHTLGRLRVDVDPRRA